MGRSIVLLVSSLLFVVAGSSTNPPSSTARRFGPESLEWRNQLSGSKLFISIDEKQKKAFDLGFDKPISAPKDCTLPTGRRGKCRSLQHCQKDHFLKSFRTFMLFHCLDGESIGVCCGTDLVTASPKRPTSTSSAPTVSSLKPVPQPLKPTASPAQPLKSAAATARPLKPAAPSARPLKPAALSGQPSKLASEVPKTPIRKPPQLTSSVTSKVKPVEAPAVAKPKGGSPASPLQRRPNTGTSTVQKVPVKGASDAKVVNIFIVLPEANQDVRLNVTRNSHP